MYARTPLNRQSPVALAPENQCRNIDLAEFLIYPVELPLPQRADCGSLAGRRSQWTNVSAKALSRHEALVMKHPSKIEPNKPGRTENEGADYLGKHRCVDELEHSIGERLIIVRSIHKHQLLHIIRILERASHCYRTAKRVAYKS